MRRDPVIVPTMMPSIISHNRDASAIKLGPENNCQTLVTKEGAIRSVAAPRGGMIAPRTPIATVGSPIPVTPLTMPARKNVSEIARMWGVEKSIMKPFALIEWATQCGSGKASLRLERRLTG
jgi:hypothetical protein